MGYLTQKSRPIVHWSVKQKPHTAVTREFLNFNPISKLRNHWFKKWLKQLDISVCSCRSFTASSITLSSSGAPSRNIYERIVITHLPHCRRTCPKCWPWNHVAMGASNKPMDGGILGWSGNLWCSNWGKKSSVLLLISHPDIYRHCYVPFRQFESCTKQLLAQFISYQNSV